MSPLECSDSWILESLKIQPGSSSTRVHPNFGLPWDNFHWWIVLLWDPMGTLVAPNSHWSKERTYLSRCAGGCSADTFSKRNKLLQSTTATPTKYISPSVSLNGLLYQASSIPFLRMLSEDAFSLYCLLLFDCHVSLSLLFSTIFSPS